MHCLNLFKWAILISVFFCVQTSRGESIHLKKNELSRINGQIQTLQKTLKEDQKQQTDLEQELKNSEVSIGQLSQQVQHFNAALAEEQAQLVAVKNTQEATLKKINMQRNALSQQLRAAYQLGQSQPFKIFLNHQDPNLLARHLTYYRYLSEARLTLMAQIRRSLSSVTENLRAIDQHQQNLKTLLAKKQQQQDQQLKIQESRQQLITSLNKNVQSKQQQINLLLTNQKALQQLVSQLQPRTVATQTNSTFNNLRHKLAWPVQGSLIATFGSPIDQGEQRLNGVIIKAPEGTPVHAVSQGKVIFANWLRGFGLLIIIRHSNNYMTLYARNHALFAKVGDKVNTGDTIATTGSSGGYDQPSLYFEIRQNGQPVNPTKWCG